MAPLVDISRLDFAYGPKGAAAVLKGIDLAVEQGSTLGLIGPNGGGKTTLVRLLLGLLEPPPGPIRGGMRQPEPRASVQERERAAGVATPSEQEQRELRELNDLSRQLAPPGTPVPAPQVAPKR